MQVALRVGMFTGDLAQLVRAVSPAFKKAEVGKADIPKYFAVVINQDQRYDVVISDRTKLSEVKHNMLMTVVGPVYEKCEQIMKDLESRLNVRTWDAPEGMAQHIKREVYKRGLGPASYN